MASGKTKLVVIKSPGKIPQIGGITGPILNPIRVSMDVIISMINAGKMVYEVNPSNRKEMVRLTRLNVLKTNFNSSLRKELAAKKRVAEMTIERKATDRSRIGSPLKTYDNTLNAATGESMIGKNIFSPNRSARNDI